MGARRFSRFKSALVLVTVAFLVFLARDLWLSALGRALIHDDGPAKAEIAVVLGGDQWGNRLLKAADLVKQGYVPRVLVSGPPGMYDINEADAAIQFAVRRGCPVEWFIPLAHEALSTREEAGFVLDDLKQRGIHSFLLVTSDYHTGRARRIFLDLERRRGGGPDIRAVASPDRFFSAGGWWHNREGCKTMVLEWTKTVTAVFGI